MFTLEFTNDWSEIEDRYAPSKVVGKGRESRSEDGAEASKFDDAKKKTT